MNSKQFQELQEAYMNVYQEIDEANDDPIDVDHKMQRLPNNKVPKPTPQQASATASALKLRARAKQKMKEEVDIYDAILSHLIDEGYASTEEAATAIMVNMSEEWRDSVVEGYVDWRKGSLTVPSRVKGNKRTQSPEERAGDSQFRKYADAQTTRGTQAVRGARGKKARLAAKQQEVIQKTTQNYNEKNKG